MLIRDLAWLVTVADHGHVTDAAAALRTGQPTLSRAVARVEAELGVRVFERVPEGVRVTPTGELVVAAARELTGRYDALRAELEHALDPDTGVVRLAFLDSIATSLVPRLLHDFHDEAPRVRVVLAQEPAHEIVADLATGAAELAISTRPVSGGSGAAGAGAAGYGWHPLQQERLVLAVPARHRLAARKRVALDVLAGEELVTTPVGFGYRALVDGLLREAGVAPAISFESQDLATIEGLVAAGLGVAVLHEQFAGTSGTVGIPISAPGARRTIGLTWRADRPLPAPAARFLAFATRPAGRRTI